MTSINIRYFKIILSVSKLTLNIFDPVCIRWHMSNWVYTSSYIRRVYVVASFFLDLRIKFNSFSTDECNNLL